MVIVMRDGRVLQGTAVQIVKGMQDIAFGVERLSLGEYVDWVVANAQRFESATLNVQGETDEAKAASLVDEMLREGLATRG
ncbi:conserved uncharacterized protein [Stigmatella aurantiaca DW4/3-1]|uniref:Conserved uncharacterized protein n=2 Tax=Stigmatella aurantiaca TaxID=41 RepID=E3FJ94_STIAD|nr:conserved uncharacterized protein [Stigmatella aurantiaca DW4/3-1]